MSNTITVQVEGTGGTTVNNVPYTSGMNAQQALEAAFNTFTNPPTLPTINFWLEYFGTYHQTYLGYMVTNMNGITQQGSNYWMLYVNDTQATKGIDSTTLSDGDTVSFKYEAYSEEKHGHTILKHYHSAKTEGKK